MKKMMKKLSCITLVIALLLSGLFPAAAAPAAEPDFGVKAYDYLLGLLEEVEYKPRNSSATGEANVKAGKYIKSAMEKVGYVVEEQPFTRSSGTINCTNYIVTKPGKSEKTIVVGAHYDSVTSGKSQGVDDNASGVAVTMETTAHLYSIPTDFTIKFIFFDAEENGKLGSQYYVNEAEKNNELENIIAMVNLDSLYAGDYMYIYGGMPVLDDANKKTGEVKDDWFFQFSWNLSENLGLDMNNNIGINESTYPKSSTGTWSDHYYFSQKGIPFIYFEATHWDSSSSKTGEKQVKDPETGKFSSIMHTVRDNLEYLNTTYPGRGQDHLSQYSELLYGILTTLGPDSSAADKIISDFGALDASLYTKESYNAVADLIAEYPVALLPTEQEVMDEYTMALTELFGALELLPVIEIPDDTTPKDTAVNTEEEKIEETDIPKTGLPAMMPMALTVLTLAGAGMITLKKKK